MKNKEKLYWIAAVQAGYFTFQQAIACGYVVGNIYRNIQALAWKRVMRGIYRIFNFYYGGSPELFLYSLWSHNRQGERQGIWSHETALKIYGIIDYSPPSGKINMTVPVKFKKSSPRGIILRRMNIPDEDTLWFDGYTVTSPLRTLFDIITENVLGRNIIKNVLVKSYEKGFITINNIRLNQFLLDFCRKEYDKELLNELGIIQTDQIRQFSLKATTNDKSCL